MVVPARVTDVYWSQDAKALLCPALEGVWVYWVEQQKLQQVQFPAPSKPGEALFRYCACWLDGTRCAVGRGAYVWEADLVRDTTRLLFDAGSASPRPVR